jgi:prepilin signal peptidase PulO-like enzyme (type II secretory pathway)
MHPATLRRRLRSLYPWAVWGSLAVLILAIWAGLYAITLMRLSKWEKTPEVIQAVGLSRGFDVLVGCWFFAVGSSIGSFLNVVAYRLPRRLPWIGSSMCPYCNVPIQPRDNIPVLGWLLLRGRCRACRLPISARYPTYELLAGLTFLGIYLVEVWTRGANLPYEDGRSSDLFSMLVGTVDWETMALGLFHCAILTLLLCIGMIQLSGQQVPIQMILVGAALTILVPTCFPALIVVPWGTSPTYTYGALGPLDALATGLAGALAGFALGRITQPALFPLAHPRWLSSHPASHEGLTWCCSWALIGSAVGWQGVFSTGLWSLPLLAIAEPQRRRAKWESPAWVPTAWLGTAMLIHLALWSRSDRWSLWPGSRRHAVVYLASACLIGWGYWLCRVLLPAEPSPPSPGNDDPNQNALDQQVPIAAIEEGVNQVEDFGKSSDGG